MIETEVEIVTSMLRLFVLLKVNELVEEFNCGVVNRRVASPEAVSDGVSVRVGSSILVTVPVRSDQLMAGHCELELRESPPHCMLSALVRVADCEGPQPQRHS